MISAEREFFVVNQTTFREFLNSRFPPNLITKRISVSRLGIRKIFSKIFTLGVICLQNLKSKIGRTGTSLRAGYSCHGMHCREILCTPRCCPRAMAVSELLKSGQLFCKTYGCGAQLRSVKVAKFSDFGLFSPYKTPKTYLPVTSLTAQG